LLAQFFTHEPSSAVLIWIWDLADTGLRGHLLESVDDGEVFGLDVFVEVFKSAQCFRAERALCGQLFEALTHHIEFDAHVVQFAESLEKLIDWNTSVGLVHELIQV